MVLAGLLAGLVAGMIPGVFAVRMRADDAGSTDATGRGISGIPNGPGDEQWVWRSILPTRAPTTSGS